VGLGRVTHRLVVREVEAHAPHETRRPVLIYGAGSTGKLLAQKLLLERDFGLVPVGFIDDDPTLAAKEIRVGPGERGAGLKVLGSGADLEALVEGHAPVAVFFAASSASAARVADIQQEVESFDIPLYFVPVVGPGRLAGLRTDSVDGIPVLTRRQPAQEALYAAAKRIADLVLAFALLVVTAPVMAIAALLVCATSDGPAIFTQRRVGLDGALFTIYKLRTMFATAPTYGIHPQQAEDERVTPIGRWLRRLSLDELPQLYNIIRGEMSFVGPRPEMPFVVERYDDTQLQRLTVKPGLTGLWQISPDRAFKIHDNIHYDLYYVEHRSLALDLAICILTPFMLLPRGRAR
jgi:exopolysaccharide biosynthesis polyprenyl glycosylphosphotransferase